eukprot:TRINITY_DN1720_c2_g1_i1.p2 TRINITY_DN1720_c2_g1~~TRINITY_DN1720_c2_g1_i1.p2  ORF type:complete len:158 (-),score=34.52 TRINITY_DN1720_c2_g1_i1:155-607(-)
MPARILVVAPTATATGGDANDKMMDTTPTAGSAPTSLRQEATPAASPSGVTGDEEIKPVGCVPGMGGTSGRRISAVKAARLPPPPACRHAVAVPPVPPPLPPPLLRRTARWPTATRRPVRRPRCVPRFGMIRRRRRLRSCSRRGRAAVRR